MNATEIVVSEMQSNRGLEMRQLLAESERQPRKTTHLLTHGQVAALHEARGNMGGIRIASTHFGYNPLDRTWGVPRIGAVILSEVPEQFSELREIYIKAKCLRNARSVVNQSICRNLRAAFDAVVQVPEEQPRVHAKPLSDVKRRNQFGFRVNRHVNPLAPELRRIAFSHTTILFLHEGPDFIDLQIPGLESAHSLIHQACAALARDNKQTHDSVAIQAREPFCAADRTAFQKAMQRTHRCVEVRGHRVSCQPSVRFRKSGFAGGAFPTLDAAFAEGTSFHANCVLAFDAGHGVSPLALCEETSQNRLSRSEAWVTPRFGLAPTPVSAEAGALIVKGYPLGWINGNFHRWAVGSEADCNDDLHCFPPFYRAVLRTLRGLFSTPKLTLVQSKLLPHRSRRNGCLGCSLPLSSKRLKKNAVPDGISASQERGKYLNPAVFLFPFFTGLFLYLSALYHAFHDHLYARLGIRVITQVVPQAFDFRSNPVGTSPRRILRTKNCADFVSERGMCHECFGILASVHFDSLFFTERRKGLDRFSNHNQSLRGPLLICEELRQLRLRSFVSLPIIRRLCHA